MAPMASANVVPRPEIHRWRSRSHGRRRKLSRKYRLGRRDWVFIAVLIIGTATPAILFSLLTPSRHTVTSKAIIAADGLTAVGKYEGSIVEMTVVAREDERLLLVEFSKRSKPSQMSLIPKLTFNPQPGSSRSLDFKRTSRGYVSTGRVGPLNSGAILTISGIDRHRLVFFRDQESQVHPTSAVARRATRAADPKR